jgi:hypothetical protein
VHDGCNISWKLNKWKTLLLLLLLLLRDPRRPLKESLDEKHQRWQHRYTS